MAAVREMLLGVRGISVSQQQILGIIGEPSDAGTLAAVLNERDKSDDGSFWLGTLVEGLDDLRIVYRSEQTAVALRESFSAIGHSVILPRA